MFRRTRLRFVLCILVALVAGTAAGAYATVTIGAAGGVAVREPLAAKDNPVGGAGRTLGLSRVTIPAGVQLALHHHAGTQVAYIEKGVLTYTVKRGTVSVMRGAADDKPALVRRIAAGQTGSIGAGEWIVEQPTTIHRAANRTSKPIVIYLATLFPIGSPPSIPVK